MSNIIDARERFMKLRLETTSNGDKKVAADMLVFACLEKTMETLQKAGLPVGETTDDVFRCNLQEYHDTLRKMIIKRIDVYLNN